MITLTNFNQKKIGGLLFLKFLLALVYCILASLKDTLLITAYASRAEVIPIIKGAIIFPLSIAIVIFYNKLDNHFKQATIFYGTIITFLCLIFTYSFFLYPHEERVSPNIIADELTIYLGGKYIHWIAILRHWIHVLFFIIAELWGQVILMVLYWHFANSICSTDEGKKYYGILIAAGDLPLIITARLIHIYLKKNQKVHFLFTVQDLSWYILGLSLMILLTYWWINHTVKKNSVHSCYPNSVFEKIRLSTKESFHYIISSKYLTYLAIIVISCGFSVNLMETTWKSHIKDCFPRSIDYQNFSSSLSLWAGIFALGTSLFCTRGFIEKFGWYKSIKIAPICVGIMGSIFFLMTYAKNSMPYLQNYLGANLEKCIIFWGALQSLAIRVVKYAFFDKTIQIAYISLDQSIKVKGKTAVDILGSNIGKAGSSWIQIGLLGSFGTSNVQTISLLLCFFLLLATIFWYKATNYVAYHLNSREKGQ